MTPVTEKYRRLPGRRRAIGSNSSLWLGSDHILLVKSSWFREEYKRFYLRDIQAIVVARGPRFYLSTPLLLLVLAWLFAGFGLFFLPAKAALAWGGGLALMLAFWLVLSLTASCHCRLYTAVSHDDLPSLFRTRTARRFLRQVEPQIAAVQGVVDAGWIEAEPTQTVTAFPVAAPESQPRRRARAHTLISDLFVLSLLAGSAIAFANARVGAIGFRVYSAASLLELVVAIAVLVENYRGRVGRGMQRLAIAALILIGITFYLQAYVVALGDLQQVEVRNIIMTPAVILDRVTAGISLLLGLIGLGIILRSEWRKEPGKIRTDPA